MTTSRRHSEAHLQCDNLGFGMMNDRDLVGYDGQPPHPRWPSGAKVAVQFVLNVEEGAVRSILNGDA